MGITGLIQFVEGAIQPSSIKELEGKTVAVDSYWLLHKGSYCCSDKLVRGIKTTAMIDYAMKYVRLLQSYCANIIMVFDGRPLPAKAATEQKRRENRQKARLKADELVKSGRHDEAKREFDKAVVITHEHALELMEECRRFNVECIVAPFEADGQLAYLNKIGLAEYVISEDSDLILFGCKKIVYKLTLDGRCTIYDSEKLHTVFPKLTFEKFRRICILSGCDYVNNLSGVGLNKARKFITLTAETDMKKAIPKIPSYLNLKVSIPDDYIENFLRAEATFKHMYVYDPIKKSMTRLNDLTDDEDEQYCVNAGELMKPDEAYQLALGNINPKTMQYVSNYDPLKVPSGLVTKPLQNTKYKPLFKIWTHDGRKQEVTTKKVKQQTKIAFVPMKIIKPEVQKITEEENNFENQDLDDLISSYCGTSLMQTTKVIAAKRTSSVFEDDAEVNTSMITPSKNPFAKRQSLDKNAEKAEECSLIKSIANKDPKVNYAESRIVSRFFSTKPTVENPLETIARIEESKLEQEKELLLRLEENRHCYNITKDMSVEDVLKSRVNPLEKIKQKYTQGTSHENNTDDADFQDMELTHAQTIDVESAFVDNFEVTASQNDEKIKKSLTLVNKTGNSKKSKTKTTSKSTASHRLSKFGFTKTAKIL